jgi:phosphorylcholine metabolism protein LicD
MNKYILYTLVFLLILLIISFLRNNNPFKFTNEQFETFYSLFERFDKMCTDNNIKYFIIAGSLLGAVRHGEMIPWDDDIDVGIFEEDLYILKNVDLKKYGLQSHGLDKNNIGKITFENQHASKKMQDIFIDIFVMENKNNKIQYTSQYALKTWPGEYFNEDELYPLKYYKFGRLKVSGPKKYKEYCKRAWGNNWDTPKFKGIKKILYPFEMIKYNKKLSTFLK